MKWKKRKKKHILKFKKQNITRNIKQTSIQSNRRWSPEIVWDCTAFWINFGLVELVNNGADGLRYFEFLFLDFFGCVCVCVSVILCVCVTCVRICIKEGERALHIDACLRWFSRRWQYINDASQRRRWWLNVAAIHWSWHAIRYVLSVCVCVCVWYVFDFWIGIDLVNLWMNSYAWV